MGNLVAEGRARVLRAGACAGDRAGCRANRSVRPQVRLEPSHTTYPGRRLRSPRPRLLVAAGLRPWRSRPAFADEGPHLGRRSTRRVGPAPRSTGGWAAPTALRRCSPWRTTRTQRDGVEQAPSSVGAPRGVVPGRVRRRRGSSPEHRPPEPRIPVRWTRPGSPTSAAARSARVRRRRLQTTSRSASTRSPYAPWTPTDCCRRSRPRRSSTEVDDLVSELTAFATRRAGACRRSPTRSRLYDDGDYVRTEPASALGQRRRPGRSVTPRCPTPASGRRSRCLVRRRRGAGRPRRQVPPSRSARDGVRRRDSGHRGHQLPAARDGDALPRRGRAIVAVDVAADASKRTLRRGGPRASRVSGVSYCASP